jgi:hypothetical protein
VSDQKDAAEFVAENRGDIWALVNERDRRLQALKNAPSFGFKVLARARLEAFDRAIIDARIPLQKSEGDK